MHSPHARAMPYAQHALHRLELHARMELAQMAGLHQPLPQDELLTQLGWDLGLTGMELTASIRQSKHEDCGHSIPGHCPACSIAKP